MTVGEVEEFLWTLSTCLEGRIGDWRLRFGGALVSVRVDPDSDQVTISAPIAFEASQELPGHASPTGVRYSRDGSRIVAACAARLSHLTMNGLQTAFQRVVDGARQPAPSIRGDT
jgi:hypothetical protein